ncbi:MAG: hypothetical protein IJH41_01775 [Eubacterium sp.]|nr:hypothetical protein [Eubacterium sp.]
MNDPKQAAGSALKSIKKYWKGSGREARAWIVASVIIAVFFVIFCFNLISIDFDAAYSEQKIKAGRKAVEEHDWSDVKTVESIIKTLEAREVKTVSTKAKSNVYYLKKFRDSVILGDSITEGLTVYGFLPDDIVLCSIGASLDGSGPLFRKAAKLVPENAFFTFGMNDMIKYRGKTGPFIRQYSKLLAGFQKKSPDTVIYINSISRPSKDAQKNQPSLKNWKKFNKALQELCDEKDYIYLDNTYILEEHKNLYQPDGIHVMPAYYPVWMNNMIRQAGL